MAKIRFFGAKARDPRGFNFVPQHYDAAKEELAERLAKYKTDDVKEQKELTPEQIIANARNNIRGGFRAKQRGVFNTTTQKNTSSNKRLFYIIVALCVISYLILRSDMLLRMVQRISAY
jgi:hypothetical protein